MSRLLDLGNRIKKHFPSKPGWILEGEETKYSDDENKYGKNRLNKIKPYILILLDFTFAL